LGSDIGVGITGIAGPDGGSNEKPVGLVQLCVAGPASSVARQVNIPGSRAEIRTRAVTVAMHLIRELLN
jgi:nicotinamide-nucleotide amidase